MSPGTLEGNVIKNAQPAGMVLTVGTSASVRTAPSATM